MLNEFEQKVADFITKNNLFSSESKVLLAVSGGADSIALLHVINALKNHGTLNVDLHIAHINHQLRAVHAEHLLRRFASENKLSIETAARKLRIENLTHIAQANNFNCIATGHQKNDNAETIIHRLLRGTGYRGLAGLWSERIFNSKVKFIQMLIVNLQETTYVINCYLYYNEKVTIPSLNNYLIYP